MAERTGFLYPFLDGGVDDPGALLAELSRSAAAKRAQSEELRARSLRALDEEIATVARAVAGRITAGGRILAFGNGGSATDAEAFVLTCAAVEPRAIPAVSLVSSPAVLTALANDIGVDAVFARPLTAHGRSRDVAVAFSTSGGSTNVLAALDAARSAGMLSVGFAGYGGGALRDRADHCLAVDSDSVHRIQEAQTAIATALVDAIGRELTLGVGK